MIQNILTFWNDIKFAVRSLARTKGLTFTVVLTLALGIGANAAIFSVVRGVLLRPLVNRDEDRLIYISQSARGIGADNVAFSVPEIRDLEERVKTLSAFGDFSTIGFTMAPWTARSSARADSRSAPGASRPNNCVIRCTRPVTIVADK